MKGSHEYDPVTERAMEEEALGLSLVLAFVLGNR